MEGGIKQDNRGNTTKKQEATCCIRLDLSHIRDPTPLSPATSACPFPDRDAPPISCRENVQTVMWSLFLILPLITDSALMLHFPLLSANPLSNFFKHPSAGPTVPLPLNCTGPYVSLWFSLFNHLMMLNSPSKGLLHVCTSFLCHPFLSKPCRWESYLSVLWQPGEPALPWGASAPALPVLCSALGQPHRQLGAAWGTKILKRYKPFRGCPKEGKEDDEDLEGRLHEE